MSTAHSISLPPVLMTRLCRSPGNAVEARVFIVEVREDGKDHARDARFAAARPFRPGTVADAAIALESLIKQEPAGQPRRTRIARQTEIPEQQHGVSRRSPLGRVQAGVGGLAASPGATEILSGKQTRPPAF